MMVLISRAYEGCRTGDVVRFEDKAEGLAAVAAGAGVEARWDNEKQEYVEVVRVTAEVGDSASAQGGAA